MGDVPRSIVQFLESQIAEWEIEISTQKDTGRVVAPPLDASCTDGGALDCLSQAAGIYEESRRRQLQDDLEANIIHSSEFRAMVGATIPTDPALTDLVSRVRMGLTPSFVLPVITGQSPESRRVPVATTPEGRCVDASTLATLPDHVIHTLVRKYVRCILPQASVMLPSDVDRHLDIVLAQMREFRPGRSTEKVEPSFSFLVIYIILAISSTLGCAKSQHESRCIAFSEILFREGISHLSTSLPFPDDLAGLQATLLILQYAEINPKCANIWILNGSAMRSCLELGLHREPVRAIALDDAMVDLRRRVFWTAYCLDRTVSPALQRPLSIPDSVINARVPTDLASGPDEANQASKHSGRRWIEHCRIQSELAEVHFQGKPLNRGWSDWVADMDRTLTCWYRQEQSPDDAVEFAYTHGLVRLHRPSPRNPMPSAESLMSAFEAACRSAKYKREPILSGFVRKLWLAAHNTAETAMVAIFCLRHAFDQIVAKYSVTELFDMTKTFTANLLTLAAQGWPEISNFAATFEKLLAPLLHSVLTKAGSPVIAYPAELDAELNNFLLPGPTPNDAYFGAGFSTNMFEIGGGGDDLNWDDGFLEAFGSTADGYGWDEMNFGNTEVVDLLVSV